MDLQNGPQINQIKNFLSKREEVIAAYLFGSLARGDANKLSDIDIAVIVDKNICPNHAYGYDAFLLSRLMSIANNNIDLVILNDAPIGLKFRVIRDGKILVDKKPKYRVNFTTKALMDYYDFLPAEQMYNKMRFGIT